MFGEREVPKEVLFGISHHHSQYVLVTLVFCRNLPDENTWEYLLRRERPSEFCTPIYFSIYLLLLFQLYFKRTFRPLSTTTS